MTDHVAIIGAYGSTGVAAFAEQDTY